MKAVFYFHSLIFFTLQPPEPLNDSNFAPGKLFNKLSDVCIQNWSSQYGKEDCLYLNIFTPQFKSKISRETKLYPVFFWIHGGSYNTGSASSDHNGPQLFIEKDVIVVTINYRLGVLGFLSIPEANITGNFGLRDQQLAMKWTKENIEHFGGDPNAITIGGWSAGSASVSFHIYSEGASGLFNRAIMMSGSMLNPWSYFDNRNYCLTQLSNWLPRNVSNKKEFKMFDHQAMKPFLKSLNESVFSDLPDTIGHFAFRDFAYTYASFVPTLECNQFYEPILNDVPVKLLRNPKFVNEVPLMIGFTSREDEYSVLWNLQNNFNGLNRPRKTNPNIERSKYNELIKYIKHEFTNVEKRVKYVNCLNASTTFDRNMTFNLLLSRLSYYADSIYGIQSFAKYYQNHSSFDIFMYQFSFIGKLSCNTLSKIDDYEYLLGPQHGDDLGYLFLPLCISSTDIASNSSQFENDVKIRGKMIDMWTDFIKHG